MVLKMSEFHHLPIILPIISPIIHFTTTHPSPNLPYFTTTHPSFTQFTIVYHHILPSFTHQPIIYHETTMVISLFSSLCVRRRSSAPEACLAGWGAPVAPPRSCVQAAAGDPLERAVRSIEKSDENRIVFLWLFNIAMENGP